MCTSDFFAEHWYSQLFSCSFSCGITCFIFFVAGTRYSLADGECCPICGLHLAHSEIEAHYKKELEILSKVSEGLIQKLPFNTIEGADVNHSGFRSQTHHQHHHSNQHHSEQQIHHQHPQHHHHQQHAMEPLNKQHMSAKNPLEIAPRSRWDVSDKTPSSSIESGVFAFLYFDLFLLVARKYRKPLLFPFFRVKIIL